MLLNSFNYSAFAVKQLPALCNGIQPAKFLINLVPALTRDIHLFGLLAGLAKNRAIPGWIEKFVVVDVIVSQLFNVLFHVSKN